MHIRATWVLFLGLWRLIEFKLLHIKITYIVICYRIGLYEFPMTAITNCHKLSSLE